MNMDWVRPIAPTFEFPYLRGIALYLEAHVVTVKDFTVYDPLPVLSVEFKAPCDALGDPNWIQVERGIGGRVDALVVHCAGNHAELEHLVSLAGRQNVVRWSGAVALL